MKNISTITILILTLLTSNVNAQVVTVESGVTVHVESGVTVTAGASADVNGILTGDGAWSGALTIKSGGELSGDLTITGNVTNESGGKIAPGSSVGTINITGDLTNSGTVEVDIGPTISAFDIINVTGTFNAGGTLTQVNFSGYSPSNGHTANFLNSGAAVNGTFSTEPSAPWATQYDSPSTGDVTLNYSVAAPIELLSFNGEIQNKKTLLFWETASEINADKFEIEHSIDFRSWEKIGFVKSAGNSLEIRNYHFTDESPKMGVNYYRLRQLDMDGTFEYSNAISVRLGRDMSISVYPNPTSNFLHFSHSYTEIEGGKLEILSSTGMLIQTLVLTSENIIDIADLSKGLYYIRIVNEKGVQQAQNRFIKL